MSVNSIGTCSRCGYYGPGPDHDCKPNDKCVHCGDSLGTACATGLCCDDGPRPTSEPCKVCLRLGSLVCLIHCPATYDKADADHLRGQLSDALTRSSGQFAKTNIVLSISQMRLVYDLLDPGPLVVKCPPDTPATRAAIAKLLTTAIDNGSVRPVILDASSEVRMEDWGDRETGDQLNSIERMRRAGAAYPWANDPFPGFRAKTVETVPNPLPGLPPVVVTNFEPVITGIAGGEAGRVITIARVPGSEVVIEADSPQPLPNRFEFQQLQPGQTILVELRHPHNLHLARASTAGNGRCSRCNRAYFSSDPETMACLCSRCGFCAHHVDQCLCAGDGPY